MIGDHEAAFIGSGVVQAERLTLAFTDVETKRVLRCNLTREQTLALLADTIEGLYDRDNVFTLDYEFLESIEIVTRKFFPRYRG